MGTKPVSSSKQGIAGTDLTMFLGGLWKDFGILG